MKNPLPYLALLTCSHADQLAKIDLGEMEDPDELFSRSRVKVRNHLEPSLAPINESSLMVFGHNGNEIRPFGGNNYINLGHIYDFDGDGILDRADSTNYGIEKAENHEVHVFELSSVEPEPRTLLEVVYNWHPDSVADANRWTFECYDEDKEFGALEKRFERDHFGNPLADEPLEHKQARARLQELRDKRRFDPAAVLRKPLQRTITRLRLASDPARLIQAIEDDSPDKSWALTQLRRTEPGTWAILISQEFNEVRDRERQMVFSTLAAGHPPTAKEIIATLTDEEKEELAIEIARFHLAQNPQAFAADVPFLLNIAKDSKADLYRRAEAMEMLSEAELSPDQISILRSLLLKEIENPQKSEYGFGTLDSTVGSLMNLPDPKQHLRLFLTSEDIQRDAFHSGFRAIAEITRDDPERGKILAGYIRPQLKASRGMMTSVFLLALVEGIAELAPEIAAFATTTPDIEDGDGANYSGGNFKSPVGHRYHIAREITALWSEKDPATLARMWIAFATAHAYEFDTGRRSGEVSPALRKLAEDAVKALQPEDGKQTLTAISREIPVPDTYSGTSRWLASLFK